MVSLGLSIVFFDWSFCTSPHMSSHKPPGARLIWRYLKACACRVLVQSLCMSAHTTQSPAGIANASVTTATATSSVPLRDLLQQLGVCEELQ